MRITCFCRPGEFSHCVVYEQAGHTRYLPYTKIASIQSTAPAAVEAENLSN